MLDVLIVFGTRPELLKTAPVIAALRQRKLTVGVVATGQHSDLLDIATLARVGDVATLDIASDGSVLKFMARAEAKLRSYIAWVKPKVVVVQGDTMSAHAGALAAAALGVPVAHVEAGVRSGDDADPWPEELIRKAITRIATWHYAPTMQAVMNVSAERAGRGARNCEVLLTGNTSVDALLATGARTRAEASPTVLVTLHRRELRDRADVGDTLQALANAVAETPHVAAIWPVHPAMRALVELVQRPGNFLARGPMVHSAMAHALSEARGVLTDSGGLVEEAATLGVPTAVLRNATDRPEAEEAGIARRFAPTPAGVAEAWYTLATCAIERVPTDVFGSGTAADAISRHLVHVVAQRGAQVAN